MSIAENLRMLRLALPKHATLVAVSKGHGPDKLREAVEAGQRDFGESYVQEALPKLAAFANQGLIWHFIGPLQSNKTREVAEHFDWVHGVDRLKIAERLSAQRPAALPPLNICVQVNVSGEASKSGCAPAQAAALCAAVATLPRLRLRGLMCIPDPERAEARAPFRQLRELAAGLGLDTLSMGMSDDYAAALAEGATHIRIGTAIFGNRT